MPLLRPRLDNGHAQGVMHMPGSGSALARRLARDAVTAAAELMWPTRCVACDMPGSLLCDDCRQRLSWIDQRWSCPVCGAPYGWLTCTACEESWGSRATVCALSFDQISSQLVACLKDRSERRLAGVNAAIMATALDEAQGWPAPDGSPRFDATEIDALCFVPATPKAFARRGFDHMELVCKELSRMLGVPLLDVLARSSASDQRTLRRQEREANLLHSVCALDDVAGLRLLLADDVLTTGASMRECTRALLGRGAAEVTCCALTRVW